MHSQLFLILWPIACNHLFSDHRATNWEVKTDKEQKPQINLSINDNIKTAGEEDLKKVPGIGIKTAAKIYKEFNKNV